MQREATYSWNALGRITSVYTLANVLQFSYTTTSPTLLSKVTNFGGQSLVFEYNSQYYVSAVTDPAGGRWTYQYAGNSLTNATSPGPNADIKTYYYENTSNSGLLTGVAINGTRFSTYTYNAAGKVQESSRAGGELDDRFTYATNSTTLTDVMGQVTTYNFTAVQGGLALTWRCQP